MRRKQDVGQAGAVRTGNNFRVAEKRRLITKAERTRRDDFKSVPGQNGQDCLLVGNAAPGRIAARNVDAAMAGRLAANIEALEDQRADELQQAGIGERPLDGLVVVDMKQPAHPPALVGWNRFKTDIGKALLDEAIDIPLERRQVGIGEHRHRLAPQLEAIEQIVEPWQPVEHEMEVMPVPLMGAQHIEIDGIRFLHDRAQDRPEIVIGRVVACAPRGEQFFAGFIDDHTRGPQRGCVVQRDERDGALDARGRSIGKFGGKRGFLRVQVYILELQDGLRAPGLEHRLDGIVEGHAAAQARDGPRKRAPQLETHMPRAQFTHRHEATTRQMMLDELFDREGARTVSTSRAG